LDTREKICSLDEFIARNGSEPWTVAFGVFDPFTFEVTRYITGLTGGGRKLLVIVSDSSASQQGQGSAALLSTEARARMLASMRAVDAVIIAPASVAKDALKRSKVDIQVSDDPAADCRRTEEFVQYVWERQTSAAAKKT
jgi:glycerol-3-phosphate cytidylyltransferase-like family protein